jgi:hypothetical protein
MLPVADMDTSCYQCWDDVEMNSVLRDGNVEG